MYTNNSTELAPIKEIPPMVGCALEFKPVYHVCGGILACLIISVNVFVLHLFIKNSKLRALPANYLLISLSVNDLLSGISVLIHFIPYYYLDFHGCSQMIQNFDHSYFLAADITTYVLLISTVAHLVLLSSERCISLLYALRYQLLITRGRVLIALFLAWTIGFVAGVMQLIWTLPFLYSPSYETQKKMILLNQIYTKVMIIGFAFIPVFILTVEYTWLLLLVRRLVKSVPKIDTSHKSLKEKKTLIIYCSMFVSFLTFCVPYLLIKLLISEHTKSVEKLPAEFLEGVFLLRFVTSLVNPLLYTLYKSDFRRAAKMLFSFFWMERKRGRSISFTSYLHNTEHTVDDRSLLHPSNNNGRHERYEMATRNSR